MLLHLVQILLVAYVFGAFLAPPVLDVRRARMSRPVRRPARSGHVAARPRPRVMPR